MAKKQDDRRQTKSRSVNRYGSVGRSFNRLDGDDRDWAKSNRFDCAEYCVPVRDGKRFSGSTNTKLKCGDGRSGFSTRRKNHDEVKMEVGLDGQLKKRRSTLVNTKSARCASSRRARRVDGSRCGLVCQAQIAEAIVDPRLTNAKRRLARFQDHKWRQLTRCQKRERRNTITTLIDEVIRWS